MSIEGPQLPNPLPRPAEELALLERIWQTPRGLRFLTVINNNYIGVAYVGAAFLFFILAGILALLMRTQLAVPNNDLIGPQLYNQLFTMHGTMMMFLFAVPVMEALGVYLVPLMVGTGNIAFPRLNTFSYFVFLFGDLMLCAAMAVNSAPMLAGSPTCPWPGPTTRRGGEPISGPS